MRTFVTRCTCGTFVSDGIGNSKKLSKKRCAEKMLEEVKTLPPLPQQIIKVKKLPVNKKKNRNLIKVRGWRAAGSSNMVALTLKRSNKF